MRFTKKTIYSVAVVMMFSAPAALAQHDEDMQQPPYRHQMMHGRMGDGMHGGRMRTSRMPPYMNEGEDSENGSSSPMQRGRGRAQMFEKLDANDDGYLSKEELNSRHGKRFDEMFAKQDTNGDGVITKEEIKAKHEKRFDEMFSKKDTDNDGKISQEEFKQNMQQMRRNRMGGKGRGMMNGRGRHMRRGGLMHQGYQQGQPQDITPNYDYPEFDDRGR